MDRQNQDNTQGSRKAIAISEVFPKSGLVYSEKYVCAKLQFFCFQILTAVFVNRGGLAEVLCKPKILPLKSAVLEALQKIENSDGVDDE